MNLKTVKLCFNRLPLPGGLDQSEPLERPGGRLAGGGGTVGRGQGAAPGGSAGAGAAALGEGGILLL